MKLSKTVESFCFISLRKLVMHRVQIDIGNKCAKKITILLYRGRRFLIRKKLKSYTHTQRWTAHFYCYNIFIIFKTLITPYFSLCPLLFLLLLFLVHYIISTNLQFHNIYIYNIIIVLSLQNTKQYLGKHKRSTTSSKK